MFLLDGDGLVGLVWEGQRRWMTEGSSRLRIQLLGAGKVVVLEQLVAPSLEGFRHCDLLVSLRLGPMLSAT